MATYDHTFHVMQYYLLNDDKSIRPVSFEEYLQFLEDNPEEGRWKNKRVAWDEYKGHRVSTVFLEIDHRFFGPGDPIVFETMIFSDDPGVDEFQKRYTTYEDALQGHQRALEALEAWEAHKTRELPYEQPFALSMGEVEEELQRTSDMEGPDSGTDHRVDPKWSDQSTDLDTV